MADNKKYYYLKLKDNFYESDSIILLESMENGYLYSNILMKLYLRSLKSEGRLMFNEKIPYSLKMLSKILRHNVDIVEKAINIFKELDLIEILDNGAIYMLDIQNFIGKSSTDGDRKRLYRNRISNEKMLIGQMSDNRPPEIEIEIEKDIDLNNTNNNNTCSESIYSFLESNFNRTLMPIEYEEVQSWEDNELTRYAIKQAVLKGICNIKYIRAILHNYSVNNIQTVQQARAAEDRFNTKYNSKNINEPSQNLDSIFEKVEKEIEEKEGDVK